ncbi:MAG: hypothetical protein MUC68_00295 [Burkholderiaceae bacterium]|nr:hypothetical protein [Burkholderiaceae bacterium]
MRRKRPEPAKKDEEPQNALKTMRNQVYGGDTSRAAYREYVIETQTSGQAPMSFEEFRKSRTRNALKAD